MSEINASEIIEQLQQLKAENEKLRKENEEMYKMGCDNFVVIDQAKRLYKFNKCIDEIEKYCEVCRQARTLNIETILQLIKQAKESE